MNVGQVFRAFTLAALSSSTALAASPCETEEHRAFDFWLGEWNVRTPDGKLAGVNRISNEYGGCVLHERYDTRRGYSGESLNAYAMHRITWTPHANGSVRQLWESTDEKGQWSVAFDGTYTRK